MMNSVEAFKKVARELPPARHALAESGAQALRIEATRHGVDLHDKAQLEAFMLGTAFLYMAARAGKVDQASEGIGQFFIEESL